MVPERDFHQLLGRRVPSSLVGPVVPSFLTLAGRPQFTVRRHELNKDLLPLPRCCSGGGDAMITGRTAG